MQTSLSRRDDPDKTGELIATTATPVQLSPIEIPPEITDVLVAASQKLQVHPWIGYYGLVLANCPWKNNTSSSRGSSAYPPTQEAFSP